jgi:hypothetical protein
VTPSLENKIIKYYKEYKRSPWRFFENFYGVKFDIFQKIYLFCYSYLPKKKIIWYIFKNRIIIIRNKKHERNK